jgi:hypothetical protein
MTALVALTLAKEPCYMRVGGRQSPPSTNKITNSKQFEMVKNQKVSNEPVLDFAIGI